MPLKKVVQPEMICIDHRLRLRKYDGKHEAFLPAYQDPYIYQNSEGIFDADQKPDMDYVKRMCNYLSKAGELYYIEILEGEDFRAIGDVTVKNENPPIAIWAAEYRGQGIGTLVMQKVIERLENLCFDEITGSTVYKWNLPSQKMHEKLGFFKVREEGDEIIYHRKLRKDASPETRDLMLRRAVQEDWYHMYYNLWRHPESAKYMFWDVTTSEADAQARMERTLAYQARRDHHWLVVEKASGMAIGFAGLEQLSPGICGETGVALGPDFTGKGYGKQILNALTAYARDRLGASRFTACCRTENVASRNLQLSCGFRFSHTEERTDPRNGGTCTLEFYEKDL